VEGRVRVAVVGLVVPSEAIDIIAIPETCCDRRGPIRRMTVKSRSFDGTSQRLTETNDAISTSPDANVGIRYNLRSSHVFRRGIHIVGDVAPRRSYL
jgi:hypothetical protein